MPAERILMLIGYTFTSVDDVRMFERWIFSQPTPTTAEFTEAFKKNEETSRKLSTTT